MIFFDTETALIGPGLLAPPLTCLQFAVDEGPVGVAVEGVDPVFEIAREMLLHHEVCGHNTSYDMLVLGREHPELLPLIFQAYDECRVFDTLVREKLLHIENGTLTQNLRLSLADLARKYGGKKNADDPWRLRYSELRGIPVERWSYEALAYAKHDIDATRLVYRRQEERCGGHILSPDECRQTRAAFAFHLVGAAGVHTDQEAVEAYVAKVFKELEAEEDLLREKGLLREDGTKDTKKAQARMFLVTEEDEDIRYTPSGNVCLDEEACQESGDEVLIAYQRYGSRKTLLSRLESLRKPLINPQFDSLIASGRSSCRKQSKAVDAYQVQNTRREPGERECFVPAEGNVFVTCDYDGFEMCSFGQSCIDLVGFSKLAERINDGLDAHLFLAARILGITYEEALERKEADDEEVLETRQVCKAANFGYPGGLGPKGFRRFAKGYDVIISDEESKDIKKDWLRVWAEAPDYFDYIRSREYVPRQTKKGEQKVTAVRQLRSGRLRGAIPYTVACNTFFQGLAADGAKAALYEVVKATELGEIQDWKCWNFVHDEIIIEGPLEDGDRAARVLQRIMVDEAQKWMPDVRISAAPTMMLRWSKKAKPRYLAGRLIPWTS